MRSISDEIDTRMVGRVVLNILAVNQWEGETIAECTAEAVAYKRLQQAYARGAALWLAARG